MSQMPYGHPPHQPYVTNVYVPQSPSNGLGVAGFITSLVGIVTCGSLSPIGLLLSLIALFKRPRGMAIAGTIIGAVGSVWLVVAGLALILPFVGLAVVVNEAAKEQANLAAGRRAYDTIVAKRDVSGVLPPDAEGTQAIQSMTDYWQTPLRYSKRGTSFVIISAGADKAFGTADDVTMSEDKFPRPVVATQPATQTTRRPAPAPTTRRRY